MSYCTWRRADPRLKRSVRAHQRGTASAWIQVSRPRHGLFASPGLRRHQRPRLRLSAICRGERRDRDRPQTPQPRARRGEFRRMKGRCRFLTLLERVASRQGLSTTISAVSTTFFSGAMLSRTTVRCKCRVATARCGHAGIGFTTASAASTMTAVCSKACSSNDHGKSVCARHTLNIAAAWHATLS